MKMLSALFRLTRWPNLVFIALTQVLFYYCVELPVLHQHDLHMLCWLIAGSVLIAAAGYIINDYFDLNIDQINKPDKNVFIQLINRRWAILGHFLLSIAGLICTAIAVGGQKWYLILANLICIILLWLYSTSLKKKYIIGNVVISLLTAWTVLYIFFAFTTPENAIMVSTGTIRFFRIAFLYAAFAFIISLVREAVKDVEDMEGDTRYGCRTLPIVSGIKATRLYIMVWVIVLLASLCILQMYMLQLHWWLSVAYSFLLIIIPLCIFILKLRTAGSGKEFSYLSRLAKVIMLAGILSMIFFRIYF